jgi:hypothetical protein
MRRAACRGHAKLGELREENDAWQARELGGRTRGQPPDHGGSPVPALLRTRLARRRLAAPDIHSHSRPTIGEALFQLERYRDVIQHFERHVCGGATPCTGRQTRAALLTLRAGRGAPASCGRCFARLRPTPTPQSTTGGGSSRALRRHWSLHAALRSPAAPAGRAQRCATEARLRPQAAPSAIRQHALPTPRAQLKFVAAREPRLLRRARISRRRDQRQLARTKAVSGAVRVRAESPAA